MSQEKTKGFFRAFLDFFILFSGVSTASNLARTQGPQAALPRHLPFPPAK
jgi:hypothetical protein